MSDTEVGHLPQAIIVWPGENDFDRSGIVQGNLDVPLNAAGFGDIEELRNLLGGKNAPGVVYSSPTEPAPQTAQAIAATARVPLVELAGLRNVDFGLWQGMRWTELFRLHPRLEKCWTECPEAIRPPGGESIIDAVARVSRCLKRPLKRGVSFGIVVPEPIASIVRSVILGDPLSLSHWERERESLLETIPLRRASVPAKGQLLGTP